MDSERENGDSHFPTKEKPVDEAALGKSLLEPRLLCHGTLRRECLDYHYEPMNVGELREAADSRLDKYHFYRPRESLNFLSGIFRRSVAIHSQSAAIWRSVLEVLSTDTLDFFLIL
jgi:hypothetical protein